MKLSNKQWMMLLVGAGVLFLVYWFFFRKKKSESSYDENLMIFGNENGYTNYELDGGSLESAYGPEYGAYGSYGYESGLISGGKPKTVIEGTNEACPCGDGKEKGICFRKGSGGEMKCKTHKIKNSAMLVMGGGRGSVSESSFRAGGGTVKPKPKTPSPSSACRMAGGEWGECYDSAKKSWYKCCTFNY